MILFFKDKLMSVEVEDCEDADIVEDLKQLKERSLPVENPQVIEIITGEACKINPKRQHVIGGIEEIEG